MKKSLQFPEKMLPFSKTSWVGANCKTLERKWQGETMPLQAWWCKVLSKFDIQFNFMKVQGMHRWTYTGPYQFSYPLFLTSVPLIAPGGSHWLMIFIIWITWHRNLATPNGTMPACSARISPRKNIVLAMTNYISQHALRNLNSGYAFSSILATMRLIDLFIFPNFIFWWGIN